MPDLPLTQTVQRIYDLYEQRRGPARDYLGGSQIGDPCERSLWLQYHGVGQASFPGRILRLFETGSREEDRVVQNLRDIGCRIEGEQYEVTAFGGRFQGHLDGVILGLPEAPSKWHLLEIKTSNDKSFKKLIREGVENSKPEHFSQMQIYMHLAELEQAAYFVVNKNTDDMFLERVKYQEFIAVALLAKAKRVINSDTPLVRIGRDKSFWRCRFCNVKGVCWDETP